MTKANRKVKMRGTKGANVPTHGLFHVDEQDGKANAFWTELAVGWTNADGSVNLRSAAGAVLLPGHHYQLRSRNGRTSEGAG